MAKPNEEQLLLAIEQDDCKAFSALAEETRCGSYRLGRFPVLSLLYLYGAKKILSKYEDKLISLTTWEPLRESALAAQRFMKAAGKCLRLYYSEVVSPLEMLLILQKDQKAKRLYSRVIPGDAIRGRLKQIYAVKYGLGVRFEGDRMIPDRRPLNRREKRRITALCLSGFFAVATIVAVPTTVTSLTGYRAGGDVTRLSHINFSSSATYTLQKDITIPAGYAAKEFNCTIIGGGHKITFGKNATFGILNGKLSGVTLQTEGSPIFSACFPGSELKDLTVEVNSDLKVTGNSSALVTVVNYGVLDGVSVTVRGRISALAGNSDGTKETVMSGLVLSNAYELSGWEAYYGTIKNCTVHYEDFTLQGETMANATFAGLVGENRGVVEDCTVTGSISADTFDLAGVCYANSLTLSGAAVLSGVTNEADLSQVALGEGWTPIVGGIVIENAAVVENCKNTGNISVKGTDSLICGGIAARSYGTIEYCISSGDLYLEANTAYAGCIFGRSEVASDGRNLYCGINRDCIGMGNITASLGEETSCVGGIGGFVQEGLLGGGSYIGGGATNCFFLGEIKGDFNYFGSIVGVCGDHIYEKNSYTSGGEEVINFKDNYYLSDGAPSFGAVVSFDEDENGVFRRVTDKGATVLTKEEMEKLESYQAILAKFNK